MERDPAPVCALATRWSGPADAGALARLHGECWRYAYAGIIPGPALARMVSRRGPSWWARLHAGGGRALTLDLGRVPVGYALLGRCRGGPGVEIQELYIRPDCQGLGFGTRLFAASRAALAERGPVALTIWCLARNRIGCAFYRARGGRETARTGVRFGGVDLEQIRFSWP
jgi:GNAT superfamily N-acetyltransferase